jgi:hypothetical protein
MDRLDGHGREIRLAQRRMPGQALGIHGQVIGAESDNIGFVKRVAQIISQQLHFISCRSCFCSFDRNTIFRMKLIGSIGKLCWMAGIGQIAEVST